MSETQKHDPNKQNQASPEQLRAFRGVYSVLTKLSADGTPVMINEVVNGRVKIIDLRHFPNGYEGFRENARNRRVYVHDLDDNKYGTWLTSSNEEAAHQTGVLGTIDIQTGKGSHPSDYYTLYDDQTIGHQKFTWVYGPDDDPNDTELPGGHEEVERLGWLTPEEMEELQAKLETVDG